jgi:hypothetical protein
MTRRLGSTIRWCSCLLVLAFSLPSRAWADGEATDEASRHFERGVSLYNDADYRAALVEFKRAYALAPNPGVLYNIGHIYHQLQDYAAALRTFERYLREANPSGARRSEIHATLDLLRARVGRMRIASNLGGAEVAVDDEVVGHTPLRDLVVASVGRRKVTAVLGARPPVTRYIDVSSGETTAVSLNFTEAGTAEHGAEPAVSPGRGAVASAAAPGASRRRLIVGTWIATGVLAATAVATGVLALRANSDLNADLGRFGATSGAIEDTRSRAKAFAAATDALAAVAVVTAGVALYLTLSRPPSESRAAHAPTGAARRRSPSVAVGPGGVIVRGAF